VSDTLLATKIHIPPLRSNLVNRQILIQRLNDGITQNHRLALISAPAGYGKSTLLSEWASQAVTPVTWLSLERGENAPERFWSYFITALSTNSQPNQLSICESFLRSLRSPTPPPMEELLINCINDLDKLEHGSILILDDFHFITESQIHRDLIFLIDHLPRSPHGLHLVVASRMDPPWPLARWRARGELNELRSADLRFTIEEVDKLLNQNQQLTLSDQDIRMLHTRTEGWIVGLQMVSLSIKGLLNTQGSTAVSKFIESFTGSNRFVLDYLVDEVINQQSTELREFLYDTAVLEQFSASLCDAVTGRKDSEEILYKLEQSNLFLIPLDDNRQWYRYHHLFSEFLNIRLRQLQPERINELHQRASRWYADNNVLSEAIIEALKANDISYVNELVTSNTLAIVEHNELLNVLRHFEEIPDKTMSQKPWLCVANAWVKAYSDPTQGLDAVLHRLEDCLEGEEIASEKQRLMGHMAAIRAYLAWVKGESEQALEFSRIALVNLPEDDWVIRCHLLNIQGSVLQYFGHLSESTQSYEAAIIAGKRTGRPQETFLANSNLATIYLIQGHLHESFSILQHTLSISNASGQAVKNSPFLAYIYSTKSIVQLEWNEVEAAILSARQGVILADMWKQVHALHYALLCLARSLFAAGDFEEAFEVNHRSKLLVENVSSGFYRLSACDEIWFNLVRGNISIAVKKYKELEPLIGKLDKKGRFLVTKASLLYALGKYTEVLAVMDETICEYAQRGEFWFLLSLLPLQALALYGLSREEEALDAVSHCLTLSEPEGFIRNFVERGSPMLKLLEIAASRGIHTGYINKLLPAFKEGRWLQKSTRDQDRDKDQRSILLEPLSERELQVLRLLQSAMTSEEISRELFISVNTARTHIRNIYGKLAVHGRIEAIQKAKELDLI
jgi:LuxR family maltose regulon positive regulatory protein